MVQDYSPSGAPIYGSGIDASTPEPPSPLHWRTFALPKGDPDAGTAIGWELRIDDTRGGYAQYGDFGRGFNQFDGDYRKTSISTLDQRFERNLLLPPLVTQTNLAGVTAFTNIMAHTYFGSANQLVVGSGSTANRALFKETSSTNPALVALTYDPTAVIASLSRIIIGGASTSEQLLVGKSGAVAEVLSDLTPTSTGAMHALTSSLWGNVLSPVNAATPGTPTNIFMAGSNPASVYSLAATAALGAAPAVTIQNLPSGGAMLGIEQLQKNWPLRIFVVIPYQSNSTASMFHLSRVPGKVISINLEGSDPQDVPLGIRVSCACGLWNRTVVATDTVRVVSYDGESVRDLHLFRGRQNDTNFRWGCEGLAVWGGDLYALVTREDLTVSVGTIGSSVARLEKYLPTFDSWVPVTSNISLVSTSDDPSRAAPYGVNASYGPHAPLLPVSLQSSFLHMLIYDSSGAGKADRFFLSPPDVNPWNHYNQTGASANIAQAFATTGTFDSPYFSLPTLEGRRKKADQIVFGGQIAEGNVKVTINPNEGGSAVTFAGADASRSQYTQLVPSGSTTFDLLQIRIQLNQGVTTTKTPNGLPITIRGRAYLTDADIQSLGLPGGGF